MARVHVSSLGSSLSCILAFFFFSKLCFCFNPKHLNLSTITTHWSSAGATWYGSPDGFGSDGGACGYGNTVSQPPFSSMVTGIGPSLYNSGKECGACYQVKCTKHRSCSGKPVRVVITDFCPGGPCASDAAHFDLSGTAFGAMAVSGEENKLRDAGVLEILFARVACDYSGKSIVFHVDQGSNPYYFAMVVEYEEGDGDLACVDLKEAGSTGSDKWRTMQQSWGAVWKLDAGSSLQPPLSIRLTSQYSGQTLVAKDVIPNGWQPGATYRSLVKCTANPSCSGKSVTMVITNFCPGGPCASNAAHFDLSGIAFGALAISGEEGKLHDTGVLEVKYSRVACKYPRKNIAFHVDQGSHPYYFAVVVEYEDGEEDISGIDMKEEGSGSGEWRALQQSWGATWKLDAGGELHPPLSIRLTSGSGQKSDSRRVAGWYNLEILC